MLLEDPPAALLRHTLSNFSTQPDVAALNRINDSLSTLQQHRSLRIADAETALRKLSRQLANVNSQHKDATREGTERTEKHASEIVELDTRKFRVAKGVSELEVESERLEADLAQKKRRLQELERQGIEGSEEARKKQDDEDPTVLRLWLYRNLGITLDQDAAGNYNKATISDAKKGDVHVISIDPKIPKYVYADHFWQTMQG